jgi:hypothetical protein
MQVPLAATRAHDSREPQPIARSPRLAPGGLPKTSPLLSPLLRMCYKRASEGKPGWHTGTRIFRRGRRKRLRRDPVGPVGKQTLLPAIARDATRSWNRGAASWSACRAGITCPARIFIEPAGNRKAGSQTAAQEAFAKSVPARASARTGRRAHAAGAKNLKFRAKFF